MPGSAVTRDFLPSVNVSLGEGRETSNNASTRPFGDDPTLTRREADIVVSQLLFDGGAVTGQIWRFGARLKGAEFSVTNTALNVALRAGQAYVDVHRLREQLRIAHENVATHERSLGDVTALADAGRGRRATWCRPKRGSLSRVRQSSNRTASCARRKRLTAI